MKIIIPKKIEMIDIAAFVYMLFSLYLFKNKLVENKHLCLNVFLILMYLKIRFTK